MELRSKGKQLSFHILTSIDATSVNGVDSDAIIDRWNSDPIPFNNEKPNHRRRKRRKKPKRMNSLPKSIPVVINPKVENDQFFPEKFSSGVKIGQLESTSHNNVQEERLGTVGQVLHGELRQRTVNGCDGGGGTAIWKEPLSVVGNDEDMVNLRPNLGSVEPDKKLETTESLDWNRLMAQDPTYLLNVENSPIKYFMEEMYCGNSLKCTTTLGNEKERERVYDTIFRLPWRCELLIDVGFFVCFNSFLSLLTIMPMRTLAMFWRFLTRSSRSFLQQSCRILAVLLYWPEESCFWHGQISALYTT